MRALVVGLLGIGMATGGVIACALREAPGKGPNMAIGQSLAGCLEGYDAKIREYYNGRSSPQKVNHLFDCTTEALALFLDNTRGEKPGIYTPRELQDFLHKYFLGRQRISNGLLEQFMKLKRALVGGTEVAFTRDEIQKIRAFLQILRENALLLLPDMPLIYGKMTDFSEVQLRTAVSHVMQAGGRLGSEIERLSNFYDFEDFKALLRELEYIFEKDGDGIGPRRIREQFEFLQALKAIFVSPEIRGMGQGDWNQLFKVGTQLHAWWLHMRFIFEREERVLSGPGFRLFTEATELLLDALENSIHRHPEAVIGFRELERLLDANEKFKIVPVSVPTPMLKSVLRPFFQRVLGGESDDAQGRQAPGFSAGAIQRARVAFRQWASTQGGFEALFRRLSSQTPDKHEIWDDLSFTSRELLAEEARTRESAERGDRGDVVTLIREFRPLFHGNDLEITLSSDDPAGLRHSYHNLSQMNWIHAACRFVAQGYAHGDMKTGVAPGLSLAEFQTFYADFRELGIELNQVDPRYSDAPNLRFREGNLFVYHANGDHAIDLNECTELISYLVSIRRLSDRIHDGARAVCQPLDPPMFGRPQYQIGCFTGYYFSQLQRFTARMPGLQKYYRELSAEAKTNFKRYLIAAALRTQSVKRGTIDVADSDGLAGILHYTESLFTRFDADRSGALDTGEVVAAFPTYRQTIADLPGGKLKNDVDYRGLFTYLLAKGYTPDNLWQYAEFWWWKNHPGGWDIRADRSRIFELFSFFKKIGGDPDEVGKGFTWEDGLVSQEALIPSGPSGR